MLRTFQNKARKKIRFFLFFTSRITSRVIR